MHDVSISKDIMVILLGIIYTSNRHVMVSWCSWLSRQSNTLKVSGSSPGDAIFT